MSLSPQIPVLFTKKDSNCHFWSYASVSRSIPCSLSGIVFVACILSLSCSAMEDKIHAPQSQLLRTVPEHAPGFQFGWNKSLLLVDEDSLTLGSSEVKPDS